MLLDSDGHICTKPKSLMYFLNPRSIFFEMVGGTFKEGVYDNMRNVVEAFNKSEKVLNQKLLSFARWYNFKVVTCNPRRGNEKRHGRRCR